MYIITQSMQRGRRAGFALTLGLCSGLALHTLAAAFGISALFAASPHALLGLKLIGAGYLLYLAYALVKTPPGDFSPAKADRLGYKKLYLRGILMNLSNPKVLLFFLAFFPQFLTDTQNVTLQTFGYGALFIAATMLVFGSLAFFSHMAAGFLRSRRFFRVLNLFTAAVFAVLALLLFF